MAHRLRIYAATCVTNISSNSHMSKWLASRETILNW